MTPATVIWDRAPAPQLQWGSSSLAETARPASPAPPLLAVVVAQGPPGPPGGSTTSRLASVSLSGHRAVISTGAGAAYASADVLEHSRLILGVTTGAAAQGSPVTIQVTDEIEEGSWSWEPGPVFLGLSGQLVQPAPTGVAFVRQVGVALTATRLLVTPMPPITLAQ